MLKKILFRNNTNFQFIFATIGSIIGLSALLLSFQLIMDVQSFHSSEEELFGPNTVVIQKKVTKLTTVGMNSTEFTPEDIQALRDKDFITDVAPFKSADFGVQIRELPGEGIPSFVFDGFLQSVPNRFMDIEKDIDWNWSENKDFVPVVLPKDFLMMINYGFAQSAGIPQLSAEMLMAARLKLVVHSSKGREEHVIRIVSFSNKISSILAPEAFLEATNAKLGEGNIINPNRVFIKTIDDSYGELEDLMEEMNLDIAKSAIDVAKVKTFIAVVIGIFGIAAILIVLLSLMGFVQYSQLVINKASYEIKTLLRIGYSIKSIVKTFVNQLSLIFGIITIISIVIMLCVKFFIVNTWLDENGIQLVESSIFPAIFIALGTFGLFIISNFLNIKRTVLNLGKE
ncbi:MAG: hypothetical protein MI810_16420 [Flavobacteriales bacterium]|nr:hypothetical protein [Flavobacteriales bacterium]